MADYAVVVLAEMAAQQDCRLSASALSQSTNLPEPTVSKILKSLARHQLVLSRRGIKGGYRLGKTPDQIDMAAVITALDGPIVLTDCVDGDARCCAYHAHCKVKGKWNPVNAAMQNALERVTLEQMMGSRLYD